MASNPDILSSSIPRLETHAGNWLSFKVRLLSAVQARGKLGHFTGKSTRPVPANPAAPTEEETDAMDDWDNDEASAYYLLQQRIPDSLLMRIINLETVADRWSLIETECSTRSLMQQTYDKEEYLGRKCPEGGNVREFLNKLREDRELLLQGGVDISNQDYINVILTCLPRWISKFAAQHLASMKNQAAMMVAFANAKGEKLTTEQLTLLTRIDANALVTEISNEYDRDQREKSRRKGDKRGESSAGVKDEAMVASGSNAGKGKRRYDPKRPVGLCWNCFQADHMKTDCKNAAGVPPSEAEARSRLAKGKAAKGKGKDAAHAVSAAHDESESSDGSWDACFVREQRYQPAYVDDDIPELLPADDSDDESTVPFNGTDPTDDDDDPFREVDEEDVVPFESAVIALTVSRDIELGAAVAQLESQLGTTLVHATNADGTPMLSIEYVDDSTHFFSRANTVQDEESVREEEEEEVVEAALVDGDCTVASATDERVLLVDSGCSRHISPYRDEFKTYEEMPPKAFCRRQQGRVLRSRERQHECHTAR